jgi:transcriptional antiterminator RfaH
MLDAAPHTRLDDHQQDVAPLIFAPTPSGSRPVWCVVAAKPKAERTAHAELHRRGFEAYLPLLTTRLPNRHYRIGPLFPGYLFVRMDLTKPWNPVRLCPGVFSLLSVNGIPSICPDTVVEAVRSAVDAAEAFPASSHCWRPGTPCSLAAGPLAGMPAVVTHVATETANIAVMMFGHLRNILVPLDALAPRGET